MPQIIWKALTGTHTISARYFRRMRFNAPLLVAWVLRPFFMTIFLCILEMRRFRCPASAFYHGGVSWLVPNLTVGSIDEEVGTMVLAARLSKFIYPGWKPLLVFIVHFLLLGCGLAPRHTFCLLSFSQIQLVACRFSSTFGCGWSRKVLSPKRLLEHLTQHEVVLL